MTERQEVTNPDTTEIQPREPKTVIRAPVDIFENADGITLLLDMPGVSRERLDLQVEGDSLLVEGEAGIDMPDGMEALHADVRTTSYRRSFALSSELESDAIDASIKDGLLRVHIPKRADVRPRKIKVQIE